MAILRWRPDFDLLEDDDLAGEDVVDEDDFSTLLVGFFIGVVSPNIKVRAEEGEEKVELGLLFMPFLDGVFVGVISMSFKALAHLVAGLFIPSLDGEK